MNAKKFGYICLLFIAGFYSITLCSCQQFARISLAKEEDELKHCRNAEAESKILYKIVDKGEFYAPFMNISQSYMFNGKKISARDFGRLYRAKTGVPQKYDVYILSGDKKLLHWNLRFFNSEPWILLIDY